MPRPEQPYLWVVEECVPSRDKIERWHPRSWDWESGDAHKDFALMKCAEMNRDARVYGSKYKFRVCKYVRAE